MNMLEIQIVDEKAAKNCWKPVTYRTELKVQQDFCITKHCFFPTSINSFEKLEILINVAIQASKKRSTESTDRKILYKIL